MSLNPGDLISAFFGKDGLPGLCNARRSQVKKLCVMGVGKYRNSLKRHIWQLAKLDPGSKAVAPLLEAIAGCTLCGHHKGQSKERAQRFWLDFKNLVDRFSSAPSSHRAPTFTSPRGKGLENVTSRQGKISTRVKLVSERDIGRGAQFLHPETNIQPGDALQPPKITPPRNLVQPKKAVQPIELIQLKEISSEEEQWASEEAEEENNELSEGAEEETSEIYESDEAEDRLDELEMTNEQASDEEFTSSSQQMDESQNSPFMPNTVDTADQVDTQGSENTVQEHTIQDKRGFLERLSLSSSDFVVPQTKDSLRSFPKVLPRRGSGDLVLTIPFHNLFKLPSLTTDNNDGVNSSSELGELGEETLDDTLTEGLDQNEYSYSPDQRQLLREMGLKDGEIIDSPFPQSQEPDRKAEARYTMTIGHPIDAHIDHADETEERLPVTGCVDFEKTSQASSFSNSDWADDPDRTLVNIELPSTAPIVSGGAIRVPESTILSSPSTSSPTETLDDTSFAVSRDSAEQRTLATSPASASVQQSPHGLDSEHATFGIASVYPTVRYGRSWSTSRLPLELTLRQRESRPVTQEAPTLNNPVTAQDEGVHEDANSVSQADDPGRSRVKKLWRSSIGFVAGKIDRLKSL